MAAARLNIDWSSLHDEQERIDTLLDQFPMSDEWIRKLLKWAEHGFAYIKELKVIACVFCRKCVPSSIAINSSEENIKKFHAQLSPYCPMVTGARSRNRPLVQRQEYLDRLFRIPRNLAIDIQIAGIPWHRLNQERHRLRTFVNHPTITPQAAYRFTWNGFVYISSQNSVTCAFCGKSLDNNKLAELNNLSKVLNAHTEISPNCPMVTDERCLNLPVVPHFDPRYEEYIVGSRIPINPNDPVSPTIRPGEARHFDTLDRSIGIDYDKPVYHFARETRASSFEVLNINTEPLLDQGFFYEQEKHLCICHWCNFTFNPIDWTDDLQEIPILHALFNSQCRAMKAYTPQSFIDVLHEMQENLDPTLVQIVKLADVLNELGSRNIQAQLGLEPPSVYPDNLDTDPAVTLAVEEYGWSHEDAVRGAKRLLDEYETIDAGKINRKLENFETDGVKPVRVNPGACAGVEAGCSQNPEEDERRAKEKLKEKIEKLREQQLCKCCFSKQADTMLFPCQHASICKDCSLSMETCFVCRKPIAGRCDFNWFKY